MIDREEFFRLLQHQEWDSLAKIMYRNTDTLGSDPILQQAVRLFENEYLDYMSGQDADTVLRSSEFVYLAIETKKTAFREDFVEKYVAMRLQALEEARPSAVLDYALSHQSHPVAKEIIVSRQHSRPEEVAAIKRPNVRIRSNDISEEEEGLTRQLFRSPQEENFFEAVRLAFPTYHPYPNVALSSLLNFDKLTRLLTEDERSFFFRGVVDCVVFDSRKGYEPKFFFELDSSYHDNESAKQNDRLKDCIFAKANVKLIRIRPIEKSATSIDAFKALVYDIMRGI